jgi:Tfp pilus assembly protein PilN
MIDLMPPAIKEQLAFSKWNVKLIQYAWMIGIAVVLVVGTFWYGNQYLDNQLTQVQKQLTTENQQIAKQHLVEAQAKALLGRVQAVKAIQAGQTKFSALLSNIASVMPTGVALNAITLTGDASKPVQLTASANSYNAAAEFPSDLATSSLISGADLQSIQSNTNGTYSVTVVVGFKKGAFQ